MQDAASLFLARARYSLTCTREEQITSHLHCERFISRGLVGTNFASTTSKHILHLI